MRLPTSLLFSLVFFPATSGGFAWVTLHIALGQLGTSSLPATDQVKVARVLACPLTNRGQAGKGQQGV